MNKLYKTKAYTKETKLLIIKIAVITMIATVISATRIIEKFKISNDLGLSTFYIIEATIEYIVPLTLMYLVFSSIRVKKINQEIRLTDQGVAIVKESIYSSRKSIRKHTVYTVPYSDVKYVRRVSNGVLEIICTPLTVEYYTCKENNKKLRNQVIVHMNTKENIKTLMLELDNISANQIVSTISDRLEKNAI